MALTKKQKEMIRVGMESEFFDNPSPYLASPSLETYPYSEPWTLNLFYKVKDAGIDSSRSGTSASETFTEHFDREIRGWQESQDDKIKTYSGLQTTIGEERVRKNREERKKIVDGLARRKEKVKTKVLIF